MKRETRIVSFAVISDTLAADQLQHALGQPDVEHKPLEKFPNEVSWQLRVSGQSDADIGGMIDGVLARIAPLSPAITRLRSDDPTLTCKLQIVGYVEESPTEPGFGLDVEQVKLLATLEAFIDADLYFGG